MVMAERRLSAPEPIELVSPDDASALIAATQRELEELARRATDARQTADAVEARLRTEGADERSSMWAIVRLQRFIDDLRDEAERDAQTIVESARRGARQPPDPAFEGPFVPRRVAPRAAPAPLVSPMSSEPDRSHDTAGVVLAAPQFVPPCAPEPLADPAPAPEAPSVVMPFTPAPDPAVVPPAPEREPEPLTREPLWAPVSVVAEPAADGSAPSAETAPTLAAVAEPVDDDMTAAVPMPEPPPGDQASTPRPARKRFLRGFPLSAVLEVIAVLLVLLFILLRLS